MITEQMVEALKLFRRAKASIAADAYDGVDDIAREMLETADNLAEHALSAATALSQAEGAQVDGAIAPLIRQFYEDWKDAFVTAESGMRTNDVRARFPDLRSMQDAHGALVVLLSALRALPTRPREQEGVERLALEAFELGYCWRGSLIGQTLEDSRAVGRTLCSDVFEDWLPIDFDDVPSFDTADTGIFHAKNAIRAAISRRARRAHPPAASFQAGAEAMREAAAKVVRSPNAGLVPPDGGSPTLGELIENIALDIEALPIPTNSEGR
jgi:hypothetical protein